MAYLLKCDIGYFKGTTKGGNPKFAGFDKRSEAVRFKSYEAAERAQGQVINMMINDRIEFSRFGIEEIA